MSKEVKLLYRPGNAKVRALDPKILTWDDHKKERHNFEPERRSDGKVIYVVREEYARILLAAQPDRYFLLEPKKLSVRFKSQDGLAYQTKDVLSVMGTSKFKEIEAEISAEAKAKADAEAKAQEKAKADAEAKEPAKSQEPGKEPAAGPDGAKGAGKGPEAPKGANAPIPPASGPSSPPPGDGAL